jgi:uncharacterized Zn-binding protein involved in type VI secretion
MPAITRFADPDVFHCSGMTRLGKSSDVLINGRGVSRQTDVNTPHLLPGFPCPTHGAPIAVGSITTYANGKAVGRIGDPIAACTLVAGGSPDVFDEG